MFTSQSKNAVQNGDLVGGNKVTTVINIPLSRGVSEELAKLYEKLKADGVGDSSGGGFSGKLEHYMSALTEGDVRGLFLLLLPSSSRGLIELLLINA